MTWIDQRRHGIVVAIEAVGPESVATVEAQMFRDGMAQVGAAVHVVTTDGPGGKAGFTATAVCSVSDRPPALLVCLNRKSQSGPILHRNQVFCVNTLSGDCELVADAFAGRTGAFKGDRFGTGMWLTRKTGAPVLQTAAVAFDCRVVEIRSMGSHNIIFGAVVGMELNYTSPALVYHNRAYKRL